MATDIGPELYEAIQADFTTGVNSNSGIQKIMKKVVGGKATQTDMSKLSDLFGREASKALKRSLKLVDMPNNTLYWNIAESTIQPLLVRVWENVNYYAAAQQLFADKRDGLAIRIVKGAGPEERARQVMNMAVNSITQGELDNALTDPTITVARKFYDDFQQENARLRNDLGLETTVVRVYDEKLATRRRTAHAPTILIMQRLHVDDLVGWTKQTEPDEWEYVEVPALDENNNSFWEERYPAKDLIKMRDTNMYKFQAQYQQNPIIAGGQMIKSEWFQFYQSHPKYERIFIASDTAMKTGQHNDYSVFMVWGVFQHSIYLIDMLRGKWEAPELLKNIRMLTSQYMLWENRLKASALYIEDKASGVGLVQQLKRESRLPVIPITVTKDKVTRVEEVLPTLEAGRVFLPFDRNYGHNPQIIGECELFARDMSHSHDDIVDTLVHSINVSVGFGRTFSIFET